MAKATKDALLKRALPRRDVELDGLGTVTVRALTRAEVLSVEHGGNVPGEEKAIYYEKAILRYGMVEPEMSAGEIDTWYEVSPPAEINAVSLAIQELSGMTGDAPKQAYRNFRGRSKR